MFTLLIYSTTKKQYKTKQIQTLTQISKHQYNK